LVISPKNLETFTQQAFQQFFVRIVTQPRLHLHRGIGYLAGDPHLKPIQDLCHLLLVKVYPYLPGRFEVEVSFGLTAANQTR